MTQPVEDLSHTLADQGRDGGNQHPEDAILPDNSPDVVAVLDGLAQDTSATPGEQ